MKRLRLWTALGSFALMLPLASGASAASYARGVAHSPARDMSPHTRMPLRTAVYAAPGIVTVGQTVTLSVVAPFPSAVRLSFRSAHHAWTGMAIWQRSSGTYVASVRLIPRVHGVEQAQVIAWVTPRATGRTYRLLTQFWIRGLSMGMGMGMGH